MAEKPLNINNQARRIASQQAGQALVSVSFENKDSVVLPADESINVEGISAVMVYGACNVLAHDQPDDTAVALEDSTGSAVTVTTARLVDVRGVRYLQCDAGVTVVFTG